MAKQNEDAKHIIDGILEDARAEAQKIKQEAESRVEDRRALLSGRVQRVKDDAASEAKRRIQEINRRTDAEISRAQRRNELARRGQVLSAVQRTVRGRIVELSRAAVGNGSAERSGGADRDDGSGTEDAESARARYLEALTGWIVEGALGLSGTELEVAPAGGEEQVVGDLLPEAARRAGEVSGREVSLSRADQAHGAAPGVVIYGSDGRTLYDNRVDARMRRHENAIRRLVYQVMFPREGDGG